MGRHGTIANRKSAQDSKRSAMFTKYSRQIIVAAKSGGDPDFNPSLRVAIDKAKAIGMPNDNINRAIKKGTGELGGEQYEELQFEGYGPSGVAVIVEALTDNKNRTASFVRSVFDKNGGDLGTPGCVSYMFDKKGQIIIDKEEFEMDADDLMMLALDAGAEDFSEEEDSFEIITSPADFSAVRDALDKEGIKMASAEVTMIPQNYVSVTDDDVQKNLDRILDLLDADDDVQDVYTNVE
jgi:YebC/PmpR family DNA-binding regulatory protein